jgi:hypothetical protein
MLQNYYQMDVPMWLFCEEQNKKLISNSYNEGSEKMADLMCLKEKNGKKESIGRCCMGFLMGVSTICGIWFATSLAISLTMLAG